MEIEKSSRKRLSPSAELMRQFSRSLAGLGLRFGKGRAFITFSAVKA